MTRAHDPWWTRDVTPGFALLAATFVSFLLQNGPLAHAFHALLETPFLALRFGAAPPALNGHVIVNDALMAIFFLYVGLELKRETIEGPFRDLRNAAPAVCAALGGMIAPALIYAAINGGADPSYMRGWAVPMATDIAFALGALSLLGKRVPAGLRLFLLALAIVDDLGAIIVIALFYATQIVWPALAGAALMFVLMLTMNRLGVRTLWPYWLVGIVLWALMLASGVHATIGGVLAALTIPMRASDGRTPLLSAEHALKPWVQLGIMPLFALANAGISLHGVCPEMLIHPVALGAGLGLLIGKPVGVSLAAWLAAAVLRRRLPCAPLQMFGLSLIAGIGFTMSLFVGALAFGNGPLAIPVRVGVLGGSAISAFAGLAILAFASRSARFDAELAAHEHIAKQRDVLDHDEDD